MTLPIKRLKSDLHRTYRRMKMLNENLTFPNTSNGFEAMLEAFFNVQHNEHMKAWRWHQRTKHCDPEATAQALRDSLAQLRAARRIGV